MMTATKNPAMSVTENAKSLVPPAQGQAPRLAQTAMAQEKSHRLGA